MSKLIAGSILFIFIASSTLTYSQKSIPGSSEISSSDLEAHVSFLASPCLEGRANGETGLEIALNYIASQAKLLGLKPANGNSYFQPYSIRNKTIDRQKTNIQILSDAGDTVNIYENIFQLHPSGAFDFETEGEVVFAGYGIKAEKYNYNDFENIDAEGRMLLIMDRAPTTEDGSEFRFDESVWSSFRNIQMKTANLLFSKAKVILFVADPKSGCFSLDEQYPEIANQIESTKYLNDSGPLVIDLPGMPRIIFIHRRVADELLKDSGHTLEELQDRIDSSLKPFSFVIKGKKLRIKEVSKTEEIIMHNVAGYVEGSDPDLKNEIVIFSAHADHVGTSGEMVYAGADDNASGCAALLEVADAFMSLGKKPLRSVLFLWITGEEIGLLGSQAYTAKPLFPIENTVVNLNLDMIGRTRGIADSTSENPVTGPMEVFVITGDQSRELRRIAKESDKRSDIDFDYSLSGRGSPLQLFARSDHYNFVKRDIPVLFFTTGLHTDYHTPGDTAEKLNFTKMELIARTVFDIGYTVANSKNRLSVDNPFSTW